MNKSNESIILITEDQYRDLVKHPFISCNLFVAFTGIELRGKTIHLLK
jgi:hypothetical protein